MALKLSRARFGCWPLPHALTGGDVQTEGPGPGPGLGARGSGPRPGDRLSRGGGGRRALRQSGGDLGGIWEAPGTGPKAEPGVRVWSFCPPTLIAFRGSHDPDVISTDTASLTAEARLKRYKTSHNVLTLNWQRICSAYSLVIN